VLVPRFSFLVSWLPKRYSPTSRLLCRFISARGCPSRPRLRQRSHPPALLSWWFPRSAHLGVWKLSTLLRATLG